MGSKIITGLKIWLILLLGGLIMLPVTLIQMLISTLNLALIVVLFVLSLLITFLVYGWLFIKFKDWIFK